MAAANVERNRVTLPLHHPSCRRYTGCGCIDDLDRYCQKIVGELIVGRLNDGRPAKLSVEQREDLAQHLALVALEEQRKYDPARSSQTFSAYAGWIMRKRTADWYRREFPGTRGGLRPSFDTLDDHDRERLGQQVELSPEILQAINITVLTPEARRALELVVRPMVEEGKRQSEIATERGYSNRQLSQWMAALRRDLVEKRVLAA